MTNTLMTTHLGRNQAKVDAALTAPIAGGVPSIEAHIVYGQDELEAIARKVEEIAHTQESWKEQFLYEAVMVRDSDVIIFLGNTRCHETPLDAGCGMCGGTLDCGYFYDAKVHKYGLVDNTDRSSKRMVDGPLCTARCGSCCRWSRVSQSSASLSRRSPRPVCS